MEWVWLIVGFSLGAAAERYVLDRRWLREIRKLHDETERLRRERGSSPGA
jgi:hypothetical protein